jgi:hypothetical protein
VLGEHVDHLDAGGARELHQLVDLRLHVVGTATGRHRDEEGALGSADRARAVLARQLLLAGADPVAEVQVEPRRGLGIQVLDAVPVPAARTQGPDVGEARETVGLGPDGDHGVEPQHGEVGHVVAVEGLVAQVGVDAAEAPQPPVPGADAAPVGHLDAARVSHHHVGHAATPIHQHADLAPGLVGEPAQLPRQLLGDQALRREPSAGQALELADLTGLQTVGVAEDPDGARPRRRQPPSPSI